MKKLLALALAMIMALGLVTFASAEGEAMTTWYTFNDDYLSSVRAALGEAFNEKGIKNADQDSNGTQATQIDQIQTAIANKAGVLVVNLVESGSQGTAENIINDAKNAASRSCSSTAPWRRARKAKKRSSPAMTRPLMWALSTPKPASCRAN